MNTSANGTINAKKGVWRPTIWLRWCTGRPVTWASVVIGIAMAPNATGAVSATSATAAARSGVSPMPTSITPQIATGVPNPASASSRAPKQNAITTTWTRTSSDTLRNARRRIAKYPVASVMLKIHRALTTIHMIGQKPNTAPSSAASPACPIGIEYTISAIRIDTPRAITEAHWAFILKPPRSTNSTSSGKTAKIVVNPSEWETGSSTCLYMGHLPLPPILTGRSRSALSYPRRQPPVQSVAARARGPRRCGAPAGRSRR